MLLLLLGGGACAGATADHEALGDRHYREERFQDAWAEYQAAQRSVPGPRIWAKAGAAALRAGNHAEAMAAYSRLAAEDPARQQEAARGIERVIRDASRRGRSPLLPAAVLTLRRAAPDRPVGRLAMSARDLSGVGSEDAVGLLPATLGAAEPGADVDRLLLEYGAALRATTACEAAARTYRVVLRRTRQPALRAEAQAGLGACALQLGKDALAAEQPALAEEWFSTALAADATGSVAHQAQLSLGDTRLRQGDLLGAAIWWQLVLTDPGVSDSIARLARERMASLAAPPETG
jgi:tetratricopeptide (TPR) repeat protein